MKKQKMNEPTNYLESKWVLSKQLVYKVIDQTGLGNAIPQGDGDAIVVLRYHSYVNTPIMGIAPALFITMTVRAMMAEFDEYTETAEA